MLVEGKDAPAFVFNKTRAHGRARCPFCDGEYEVGTLLQPGESLDKRPGLTHTMPPCEKFIQEGVIEFLRAARLAGATWITYHPDLD